MSRRAGADLSRCNCQHKAQIKGGGGQEHGQQQKEQLTPLVFGLSIVLGEQSGNAGIPQEVLKHLNR